jgi:hypothetical protein
MKKVGIWWGGLQNIAWLRSAEKKKKNTCVMKTKKQYKLSSYLEDDGGNSTHGGQSETS